MKRISIVLFIALISVTFAVNSFYRRVLEINDADVSKVFNADYGVVGNVKTLIECGAMTTALSRIEKRAGREIYNAYTYDSVNDICTIGRATYPALFMPTLGKATTGGLYISDEEIRWDCSLWPYKNYNSQMLFAPNLIRDYAGAVEHCRYCGGKVAEPSSNRHNEDIMNFFKQEGPTAPHVAIWLGMNDIQSEGSFVYQSNGQTLTYTRWIGGQPDNIGHSPGQGDCVVMEGNAALSSYKLWWDEPCTRNYEFVCESILL